MERCLIAYDIKKNGIRNSVAKRLEKAGVRLQKSVYFVTASQTEIKKLAEAIAGRMDKDDSLLVLPCCENCLKKSLFAEGGGDRKKTCYVF